MKIHKSQFVFFALFTISGFTGLIYESIWSHYLKLFLGHAAYAQALVLTIFMGGMAFGAYLTARFTVPYLSPGELHDMWEAITPKCRNGLNDDQLNWLELIKALSQRDSESIAIYSSNLLIQGNYWNIQQQRIQFTAQMTALVKLKKYLLAQQLWKHHIARLYQDTAIPLPLLILDSLATQNPDRKRVSEENLPRKIDSPG